MEQYVALDVSLQKIAVCVLNASGRVVIEAEVASEPGVLIAFIRTKAPDAVRIGLAHVMVAEKSNEIPTAPN